MQSNALVRDYLSRLEAAAAALPSARRAELVGDVREHIEAAVAAQPVADEAAVRNVLDRLGSPEEIVGAETGGTASPAASPVVGADGTAAASRVEIGPLEILAILLLTIGVFVVPIVGPAVGLALVWASRAWSMRLKILITAVVLVVVFLPIVMTLSVGGGAGSQGPPVQVP